MDLQQREAAEQHRFLAEVMDARGGISRVWHQVVGAIPTAVLTTDVEGRVLDANPAALALLGSGSDLRGALLDSFVVPEQRGTAAELARAAAGGVTGSASLRLATPEVAVDCFVTALVWSSAVPTDPQPGAVGAREAARTPAGLLCCTWVVVDPRAGCPSSAGSRGADEDELLAVAQLCELPIGLEDTHALLRRVAGLATRAVPGAGWSSVTLGDPAAPDSTASDSAQAQGVDGAQWRTSQGPCVAAWAAGRPVLTSDLHHDERWPALGAAAATSPVRGALGVPVVVAGRTAGVLNLYSPQVGGFDGAGALDRARIFSAAAGAVLSDARQLEQLAATAAGLREAMASRAGIEQAKGVVAVWLDCDVDEAFEVLRDLSQRRHRKLRDIAAEITAPGRARSRVRAQVLAERSGGEGSPASTASTGSASA